MTEKELLKFTSDLVDEMVEIRKERKVTQRQLSNVSKIPQATLARFEKKVFLPRFETVIKYLKPLGYTVAIVPVDEEN